MKLKRHLLIIALMSIILFGFSLNSTVNAQTLDLTITADTYNGGYHVTCNGAANGSISVSVEEGEAPYSYLWSNGSTDRDASGIGAGIYTVTVTDVESTTASASFTVLEPNLLGVDLAASEYAGGVNVSFNQGSDGTISTEVSGGTPPYSYLWSNGEETSSIEGLTAGTYTVTVTDMNSCTAISTINLIEPGQLVVTSITSPTVSSGHNVSCHTMTEWDGSIDVTVSGGVAPYNYQWEDGPNTEDRTNLKHGQYTVRVTDANEIEVEASITLNSPDELTITVTSPEYSNGFNVSCYDCFNGSINTSVSGGASPFAYSWSDGDTNKDRINVNNGTLELITTDLNGCEVQKEITITGPDRNDWQMSGNSGSNTASDFIGTVDNSDLVFKTNNTEALRLTGAGDLKLTNHQGNAGLLAIDINGNLKPIPPCSQASIGTFNTSNMVMWTCPTFQVGIGSNYVPSGYLMSVDGKMICEEVYVKERLGWPDYVFQADYNLMSLDNLKDYILTKNHLPGVKSEAEMDKESVGVAEMQKIQMEKIEELHLYILQLHTEIENLKNTLSNAK